MDGAVFSRERARSHVLARDPPSVRRVVVGPLVLARVPGTGPSAACSRVTRLSLPIATAGFSFFLTFDLPSLYRSHIFLSLACAPFSALSLFFSLSFPTSGSPSFSLSLSLSRRVAYSRALTCEVSKTGVSSYVLRHYAGLAIEEGW